MPRPISAADFRAWVSQAEDDQLTELVVEVHEELRELENDDFFGTEGINKRFA